MVYTRPARIGGRSDRGAKRIKEQIRQEYNPTWFLAASVEKKYGVTTFWLVAV
jgi:hypothetical protein